MPKLVLVFGLILTAAVLDATPQKRSPDLMVTLRYATQDTSTVALPATLIDRALEIRVVDSRESTDPRNIGTGTNDDDLPFPIRATTDVDKFVGGVIAQLATAQSLRKSASPERVLQLRLTRFNVAESNKAIGSTYAAEVQFTFTLVDGQGKTLAEGAVGGTANRYGRARSGDNCAEVLSDALKDAFTKAISDSVMQQAWASGQPAPSASKVPAPSATGNIEERLKSLDDLMNRGVITKEEHAARRAAILKEL